MFAAAAISIVAPARLYLQARSLVDLTDPVLPMMSNVLRTTWGRGWLVQLMASLAALAGFLIVNLRGRGGLGLALLAALVLTLSPALMGHAVAADRLVVLSLGSDWLHVTAAGAWVGTLCIVTIVSVSIGDAVPEKPSTANLIAAFHPVALAAATALVVSGVASLLLRVEHLGDLFRSTYGGILAVKLALTAAVAVLGWHHARNGVRLAIGGSRSTLTRSLMAETILAAVVIGATALLVGTAPPMPDMSSMTMNSH